MKLRRKLGDPQVMRNRGRGGVSDRMRPKHWTIRVRLTVVYGDGLADRAQQVLVAGQRAVESSGVKDGLGAGLGAGAEHVP